MHRGDRPSRPRGHRDPPSGGPGLFEPPPFDLAPRRVRVTIGGLDEPPPSRPPRPPRRPGVWVGHYKVHVLDAVATIYGAAVLVAIWTHNFAAVVVMVAAGMAITLVWR